ncbi:transcriptional antiterminator Rof (Rho-off) [Bradyrhizobium sp. AZCC 1588]
MSDPRQPNRSIPALDGETLQLVAPDLHARERQEVLEAQRAMYETKYLGSVRAFTGLRDVSRH